MPSAHALFHALDRAASAVRARVALFGVTRLGRGARVGGAPYVENLGRIVVGNGFCIDSRPVQSHLVTGPRGVLTIGDDVAIGAGAAIASEESITIESGARLGPGTMLMDTDFHSTKSMDGASATAAVVIGAGAVLEKNVVVLKGARIGRNARVAAGSVVSGVVPDGAVVAGVPARQVRAAGQGAAEERVLRVVAETFALEAPPALTDGPEQIAGWDSLGTLRLIVALEDEFRVSLPDDAAARMGTVARIVELVSAR